MNPVPTIRILPRLPFPGAVTLTLLLMAGVGELRAQVNLRTVLDNNALTFTSEPWTPAWLPVTGAAAADGVDALQFPTATGPEVNPTTLNTKVIGPGRLTWTWKGSPELMAFSSSPVSLRPSAVWQEAEAIIPAGENVVSWYGKGPGNMLDKVTWMPASGNVTFASALDTTGLTWTTTPVYAWRALTIPGTTVDYAVPLPLAQNPPGAVDMQLSTTVTGPGLLTFDWTKPSAGTLRFTINSAGYGVIPDSDYGPATTTATVLLPAGASRLDWIYSGTWDAGTRLDHVAVAPLPVVTPAEATETPGFIWRTEPSNPWMGHPALPGSTDTDDALYAPSKGGYSWAEMEVTGPGVVDFQITRESPLSGGEQLSMELDGYFVYSPTPALPFFIQTPGLHKVRWIHQNAYKAAPPLGMKKVTFTPVQSPPLAQVLNPALTFTNTGTVPWQGTTQGALDGVSSAISGALSSGQKSWLETQITGPATVSFQWRLTSASDSLICLVDGIPLMRALATDASKQPETVTLAVGPGAHTVSWRHTCNNYSALPNSGAWLDAVTVTPSQVMAGAFASVPAAPFQIFHLAGNITAAPGSETLDGQPALRLTASAGKDVALKAWGPYQGAGLIRLRCKGETGGPLLYASLQWLPPNADAMNDGSWSTIGSARGGGSSWQDVVFVAPPVPAQQWRLRLDVSTPDPAAPHSVLVDAITFEPAGPVVPVQDALDFSFGPTEIMTPDYWGTPVPRTVVSTWQGSKWLGVTTGAHDGADAAWSVVTAGNNPETLICEVPGAGTLTFWARHEGSGRLRLTCGTDIIPQLDVGRVWKEVRVEVGPGPRYLTFTNDGGEADGYSKAWVDQVQWTPASAGSALSVQSATGSSTSPAPITWTETKWEPVRWSGLGTGDDQALIATTTLYGSARPQRASVTGPGLLRWRWRWTDHTEPSTSALPDVAGVNAGVLNLNVGVMVVGGIMKSGAYANNIQVYGGQSYYGLPPRAPALFCLLDNVRTRGLATAGTAVNILGWYDASLLIPAGTHAVQWELLTERVPEWPADAPAPPSSMGISGLLDTVSFQSLPAEYLTWAASKFSAPAGDVSNISYAPADDPDGDGIPNVIEYLAGTLPLNAASRPAVKTETRQGFPLLSISLVASSVPSGFTLGVQYSENLQTWLPAQTENVSATTPGFYTVKVLNRSVPGPSVFLRFTATSP